MQPKLKVEYVSTDTLAPYAHNAKKHGDADVNAICASIEQFGFDDPIGVWTNPQGVTEIVEGHGRLMAAKKLGMDSVPIIRLDHLDYDGRRAYVHVHNQTTLNTGFDFDVLAVDLENIQGFDWSEFGFEQIGIDGFGIDFELPDSEEPNFKTMTLQLTAEQHNIISNAISDITRDDCVVVGGNEIGDKVCEVVRRWAAH